MDSSLSCTFSPTDSKTAVTLPFSQPVLMSSLDVLSPVTAFIESMIIDLPAPVSPVMTLNPPEKLISADSIIAIFSILSLTSISSPSLYKFFD